MVQARTLTDQELQRVLEFAADLPPVFHLQSA